MSGKSGPLAAVGWREMYGKMRPLLEFSLSLTTGGPGPESPELIVPWSGSLTPNAARANIITNKWVENFPQLTLRGVATQLNKAKMFRDEV